LSPRYQKALAILAISKGDLPSLRQQGEVSLFLDSQLVNNVFLIMAFRTLTMKQ